MGPNVPILVCTHSSEWSLSCVRAADGNDIQHLYREAASAPTVFLIAKADVGRYLELDRTVHDAGQQKRSSGRSVSLSQNLLGREDGPVLIRACYGSRGRVVRGIMALLDQARKRERVGPYIVAAEGDQFTEMWEEAGGHRTPVGEDASLEKRLLAEPVPSALVEQFVGCSVPYQLVRSLIMVAARTDDPVVIMGETGTGKEIVARSIHQHSPRQSGRFVAVNCASVPATLLESELFGYKKGAHNQAFRDHKGAWELADGGTLFLDEIGDLELESQAKILRALQEGCIRPLGATSEVNVDVRVLVATHRDLFRMVEQGKFREDLLYRLLRLRIETPALVDSPADLVLIAQTIWRKACGNPSALLNDDVLELLKSCPWPGNVRQLSAVLGYVHNIVGEGPVTRELLEAVLERFPARKVADGGEDGDIRLHQSHCLRQLLRLARVLRICQGTCRVLDRGEPAAGDGLDGICLELERQLPVLSSLAENPALLWDCNLPDIVDRVCDVVPRVVEAAEQGRETCRREWRQVLEPVLHEAIVQTTLATQSLARTASD